MELKQLKDYLTLTDIITNNSAINITLIFKSWDLTDYNPYLVEILQTNNDALTLEYLANRLDKYLSPLYQKLNDYYASIGGMAQANGKIMPIIKNKFLFNWEKLAEGFFADYNPIHNYDMKENEDTDVNSKSNTETKNTQKYAGFNSGSDLPTASETDGEAETSGTEEFNNSARELTRKGNIGVTTTAQMLTQEFELRKRTLIDKIFNDIDSILFLDYYI